MDKITYSDFIENKSQIGGNHGFDPIFYPSMSFDFQKALLEWGVKKGRCGIFADCGLGKSLIELGFAQNIVQKTNKNVLLLTPIAVGQQMVGESEKFGIESYRSRDGKIKGKITITNYEQLHNFDPNDFIGIICDESSILKNFKGKIKHAVTLFSRKMKYRLLATATAAPNDFIELGTSSETLGYLGYMDMLNKFFKNDQNNCATNRKGRFTEATKWRLKGHSHDHFWRWVTSWAKAIRKPSNIGYSDDGYILPNLIENDIELNLNVCLPGEMFSFPAVGLKEQRDVQRESIKERCEKAAEIANSTDDFCVIWCNRNNEGDLLEKIVKDSVQVSGSDSDDSKEEKLISFTKGQYKKLIIKPKIGAWGLNWQHCNHTIFFPTHSYEQYYQAMHRFFRFGQKRQVIADLIYTDSDKNMIENLQRKKNQANEMFDNLIQEMNNSLSIQKNENFSKNMEVPKWLKTN
jgi:superfamily II DNA or RNA helicase